MNTPSAKTFVPAALWSAAALCLALCGTAYAAPAVEVELFVENAADMSRAQDWHQLFSELGLSGLQVRGARSGDEVGVQRSGAGGYHVIGRLTAAGEVELPGGRFARGDKGRLKKWLADLSAGGPAAISTGQGEYGLTPRELATIREDLAKPLEFSTQGKPLAEVVNRAQKHLKTRLEVSGGRQLRGKLDDELQGMATGTAIAHALAQAGLAMDPTRGAGGTLLLKVRRSSERTPGWPVGRAATRAPIAVWPELFEQINAEIEDTPVADVLEAMRQRLGKPILFEPSAQRRKSELAKVTVTLPAKRLSYSLILDRVLTKAKLAQEIRVDDADQPFLWVRSRK